MTHFYFTDTISLINNTQNDTYGAKVGTARTVKCRHEAINKLITNSQGQDIRTHTRIFMDSSEVVQVGDLVKILTKNGRAYRDATKEFQISEIFDNDGFGTGNLEIYC